jgi:hypothetical protein
MVLSYRSDNDSPILAIFRREVVAMVKHANV